MELQLWFIILKILKELKSHGAEVTKNILMKHGAREPFFGVNVQDLKKNLKKPRKNHELALELYATGNSDAMYLAGLMADEHKIRERYTMNGFVIAVGAYIKKLKKVTTNYIVLPGRSLYSKRG